MTKIQLLDEIMQECGFREKLAGTAMLRAAIMARKPGQWWTKEVYPSIARQFGTTPAAAERDMRYAVQDAFGGIRCSPESRKLFRLEEGEAPSVSEAVARLHRVLEINAEVEKCEQIT